MTPILAVAVFVAAYVLIASERISKVTTALAGAGIIMALGIASADDAFFSTETGVDWDVIFLLLGMMIIVSVLRRTGVFEYVAIWAAKRAKGSPFRVMLLLVLITALASAFLDNVTTVLLIVPVTLLVCERLDISPTPFLIAEVLASNIGGAATLIGDPPNIIIASRSGLTFNDFLLHMAPMAALAVAALCVMLPLLFRGSFQVDPERAADVMGLNEREAIKDHRLLVICGIVLAAVFIGFIGHTAFHIEPSVVALLGAGVLLLASRSKAGDVMPGVEWETLVFFAGLFIMVGALVKTGVIGQVAEAAAAATGGNALVASMLILGVSALLSGIVDNIPYTAAMSPVVLAADPGRRRPDPGRGAVVVAGDRRRLRRQPDRDRRQRQRRRPRDRRPVRIADLVLGVHPQGRRRHGGDDPAGGAYSGCATSSSPADSLIGIDGSRSKERRGRGWASSEVTGNTTSSWRPMRLIETVRPSLWRGSWCPGSLARSRRPPCRVSLSRSRPSNVSGGGWSSSTSSASSGSAPTSRASTACSETSVVIRDTEVPTDLAGTCTALTRDLVDTDAKLRSAF